MVLVVNQKRDPGYDAKNFKKMMVLKENLWAIP